MLVKRVLIAALLLQAQQLYAQTFTALNDYPCLYPNPHELRDDSTMVSAGNDGQARYFNTLGLEVPRPEDQRYMIARHMGKLANGSPTFPLVGEGNEVEAGVASMANWDVSRFTGLQTSYLNQRARYGSLAQTNAYQMECYHFGALNNSFTYEHDDVLGGGPNISYLHSFPESEQRVWQQYDDLVLQVSNFMIPWFHKNAPITSKSASQVSLQTILKDNRSGQYLHYIVLLFDNRASSATEAKRKIQGIRNEQIDNNCSDTVSKSKADEFFVSTLIGDRSCYARKVYSQMSTTHKTWRGGKFARVHISGQNLSDAIAQINTKYDLVPGKAFSNDLSDYSVENYALFQETVINDQGGNISLGFSGSHLMAFGYDSMRF